MEDFMITVVLLAALVLLVGCWVRLAEGPPEKRYVKWVEVTCPLTYEEWACFHSGNGTIALPAHASPAQEAK